MPIGEGEYDHVCEVARTMADARTCAVIIGGGNRGNGYAVQTNEPDIASIALPAVLRSIAASIESDLGNLPTWETMRMSEAPTEWFQLSIAKHRVWIEPRAGHCDRGRFHANYHGPFYIDAQDGFPRYFMSLSRAQLEMRDWLLWRMSIEQSR